MKKIYLALVAVCCSTVFMYGCLGPSISYHGESLAPTKDAVFVKGKKELKKYTIIGRCAIKGDYTKYTLADLKKKLLKEAESKGADAVMIQKYEIVKSGVAREGQLLDTSPTNAWAINDDSNEGWVNMEQQFDYDYGTMGTPGMKDIPIFSRVVRALFLKKK